MKETGERSAVAKMTRKETAGPDGIVIAMLSVLDDFVIEITKIISDTAIYRKILLGISS